MKPKEALESIISTQYISEDGDKYKVELLPGLTENEINELKEQLPDKYLPQSIEELLLYSRGFEFQGLDEIRFDAINQFGFEEFFPNSIPLASDGFGNFWILDISKNGDWGHVFYVCHDPAVVVKHSNDLAEFILHVDEFGRKRGASHLNDVHEKAVDKIWKVNNGFMTYGELYETEDTILREFGANFDDNFVFVDLRTKPNKTGFAWGKFGSEIHNVKRHETELIWALEKQQKKRGFFAKLLGHR
ncbi:SMI1/KNR4 family protein [Sphingobacterium yanglingense]|uniref:SMI1/KNR4 family protein SUKH-1 n=1 Tax=Sphingobacterium yanglingense TaxID=1437280 RepID=A0A4R6WFY4_9SPHI|nr:SMI1/KNR4 family protein [Sphingobacterium yanglingense]TDQ79060.1 SMI1/KNR4 family protein SUKH-1 [Sphingobacterium yanglingense]